MSRQRFSTLHSALPRDFADRSSTSAGRKIAHSNSTQQPASHPPNPPARMPARSHRFARILGLFLTCLLVSSASPTGTLTPLARSTCTPTNTTTLPHTDRLGPATYKTQLRPSRPKAAYSGHGTSCPSYSPLYPTSLMAPAPTSPTSPCSPDPPHPTIMSTRQPHNNPTAFPNPPTPPFPSLQSVSARGSMGHLGHHPVGHREQRGLWAQAGHGCRRADRVERCLEADLSMRASP